MNKLSRQIRRHLFLMLASGLVVMSNIGIASEEVPQPKEEISVAKLIDVGFEVVSTSSHGRYPQALVYLQKDRDLVVCKTTDTGKTLACNKMD